MGRSNKYAQVRTLVAQCGGWSSFYRSFGEFDKALNNAPSAVPCPKATNPKKGSTKFRFYRDFNESGGAYHNDVGSLPDGIEVMSWYWGLSNKFKVIDKVVEMLNGDLSSINQDDVDRARERQEQAADIDVEDRAKALWALKKTESETIHASLSEVAKTYLSTRRLVNYELPCNVGFHPKLVTYSKSGQRITVPGIVMYIQTVDGACVNLHRIFLKSDGSGKSELTKEPKMQFSKFVNVEGYSIQLAPPLHCVDDAGNERYVLAACEGPETGFTIHMAEGIPVWCGISSTIMEKMDIPPYVTDFLIFEDKDCIQEGKEIGEGERAGASLEEKIRREHPNCRVTRFQPPKPIKETAKSQDWNDEWCESARVTFPDYLAIHSLTPVGGWTALTA